MNDIKVTVDYAVNAAYLTVMPGEVVRTVDVNQDVSIDLDALNMVIGIELLDIQAELPFSQLITDWHVHSEVIESLRRLRPSLAFHLEISTGHDGAT